MRFLGDDGLGEEGRLAREEARKEAQLDVRLRTISEHEAQGGNVSLQFESSDSDIQAPMR